jgi:hypothetical protein
VAKTDSARRVKPSVTSSSRNFVNANLDPRLQDRTLGIPSPSAPGPSSNIPLVILSDNCGSSNVPAGAERQLQKLEEEVLTLRIENVVKDREIRLLRSENERLRSADNEFQTGNKRSRLHGNGQLPSALQ